MKKHISLLSIGMSLLLLSCNGNVNNSSESISTISESTSSIKENSSLTVEEKRIYTANEVNDMFTTLLAYVSDMTAASLFNINLSMDFKFKATSSSTNIDLEMGLKYATNRYYVKNNVKMSSKVNDKTVQYETKSTMIFDIKGTTVGVYASEDDGQTFAFEDLSYEEVMQYFESQLPENLALSPNMFSITELEYNKQEDNYDGKANISGLSAFGMNDMDADIKLKMNEDIEGIPEKLESTGVVEVSSDQLNYNILMEIYDYGTTIIDLPNIL